MSPLVATAGWNLRKEYAAAFPAEGSHLERYAARLNAVEINSSFYRPHQAKTYERWASSTPEHFRFAVKLPRRITHIRRLKEAQNEIEQFAGQVAGLGQKLGALLAQMPPCLVFESKVAQRHFDELHSALNVPIFCEPRHHTWFTDEVDATLREWQIPRVAADPAIVPVAAVPGGSLEHAYFRWHGSPRMYYSGYTDDSLHRLASLVHEVSHVVRRTWCVFDNTAEGFATADALKMMNLLQSEDRLSEEKYLAQQF